MIIPENKGMSHTHTCIYNIMTWSVLYSNVISIIDAISYIHLLFLYYEMSFVFNNLSSEHTT